MKKFIPKDTARKSGVSSLKDAIDALLEAYQLRDKMDGSQIERIWKELMGEAISQKTASVYIKNRVLYLKLESAALKNELTMSKSKIMEHLNQRLGNPLIDNVVFI
jgi:predicted nucleic acid-binding Zn ribbon protein